MQAIDVTDLTEAEIRLLETRPTTLSIDPATGIGTPVNKGATAGKHSSPATRKIKTKKSCTKMNRQVEKFGSKIYDRDNIFQPQHLPAVEIVKRLGRKEGENRLDFMEQVGIETIKEKVLPRIHRCGLKRATRLPLLKELEKFCGIVSKKRVARPKSKKLPKRKEVKIGASNKSESSLDISSSL